MSERAIIWDWDGTLADTLSHKYVSIWEDVFPGASEIQQAVISFIQTPEGKDVNRWGLVRHACQVMGRCELTALDDASFKGHPEIREWVRRYDASAKAWVREHGVVRGAVEVLQELAEKGYTHYLISGGGTDDDLIELLVSAGVRQHFSGVFGFGHPGTVLTRFGKEENFRRVCEQEGISDPMHYIAIGDSETDHRFAQEHGILFVGVASPWNRWREGNESFPVITRFDQQLVQIIST